MFISIEQIKAARALLKWTQSDLAQYAGLKDDQVRNFEFGRTKSLEVLEAIYNTLTRSGLEFANGGVIPAQIHSCILPSYMDVLNDIIRTLPNGGEVLKHCVDDKRSTPEIIDKVREMRRMGIRDRMTISEGNDFITGFPEQYRQIPKDYFSTSEVSIVYANKVAFFVEGKVLLITSQTLAKIFQDQFEYWWKEGKTLYGK